MSTEPEVKAILYKIHNRRVNDLSKIVSILAIPALVASLLRIMQTGWSNAIFLQIFAVILTWCIFLLKNRLRYWIKALVLLSLLFILGINGIFHFGLSAAGRDFFFVFTVLAILSIGLRAGLSAYAVSLIFLIGFGITVTNHWIIYKIDFNIYNVASSSWITFITIWSIFVGLLIVAANRLQSAFIDALSISKQQTDKLQQLQLS